MHQPLQSLDWLSYLLYAANLTGLTGHIVAVLKACRCTLSSLVREHLGHCLFGHNAGP